MIVVTGGAGFIGSNTIHKLNQLGHEDILAVDDLSDGSKFNNLVTAKVFDYEDKDDFITKIRKGESLGKIDAVFHIGACSTTTEWDGKYMMHNNYEYSKLLLNYCLVHNIPFIYASSAAVYGKSELSKEDPLNERPLNIYGYSKLLFDRYVRRIFPKAKSQVIGLRYFNVYGPREQHKGSMASVAFHLNNQHQKDGILHLFEGSDGYSSGEQRRDFVYIDDVVDVNVWVWQKKATSGIYNVGTGHSQPFNDIAKAIISWYGSGKIQYIPFPQNLIGHYQSFTEANLGHLRKLGYQGSFKKVEEGVKLYLDWLNKK